MESSTNIIHYPSQQAYLDNRGVKQAAAKAGEEATSKASEKSVAEKAKPKKKAPKEKSPKSPKKESPKPQSNAASEAAANAKKSDGVDEAAKHLGKQALDSAKESLKSTPLKMAAKQVAHALGGASHLAAAEASSPSPDNEVQKGSEELSDLKEMFKKSGTKAFFVRGFDWWGMGGDGGLKEMASELPNASYNSWKDEEQILQEIEKLEPETPVALVGHSLGGDTAVSVANKLNQLKRGYRPIDLLVTLDSVGFDNDIIPENVKKNLNYLSEHDGLLNDGPNMPRNEKSTEVLNEIRPEGHLGVDDSPELKRKIFTDIHRLAEKRAQKLLES